MPRPSAVSADLTSLLGFLLVLLGGEKLVGLNWSIDPVFRLGVSGDIVRLVGLGEVLVGALLIHRPFRGWGNRLFVAWMAGALTTHIAAGDTPGAVVAACVLALGIILALQARPANVPLHDGAQGPAVHHDEGS